MVGKATEKAVLIIDGQKFEDWETVSVRHAMQEAPPFKCRFTCSEGMPLAKNWGVMRIRPGQTCQVTLAGYPAFNGHVVTRQVYYDAHRHHIEIQCAGLHDSITGSVVSKTMEWKDKTFKQIADEILNRIGVNVMFEGGAPPSFKFPRASATPGESIYDFLDTLARGLSQPGSAGISFTSNPQGDFVVAMGPLGGSDQLVEGVNILVGREIIYNPAAASSIPQMVVPTTGQRPGDDKTWGPQAALKYLQDEQVANPFPESGAGAPSVVVTEVPAWDQSLLKGRATSEGFWKDESQVTVIGTVYGWLRPSGGLWERNQIVIVTSPMLIMQGEPLKAKSVTFTQDNQSGTRTTLELVNKAAEGKYTPPIQGR